MLTDRRRGRSGDLFPPAPDFHWAYFFDIDGTLAEIAAHPASARIERAVRDLIQRLYVETGGAVAIITGRSIGDADNLVGIPSIPIAGQHGLERRTAAGELVMHDFDREEFNSVCSELALQVSADKGIVTELKGASIALHYRGSPRAETLVTSLVEAAKAKLGAEYTTLQGKMVVELKPAGKDKGVAVSEFLSEAPFNGRVPLFAGDDITDEFGFKVVNAARGHSIKVGGGTTCARWRLRTVAEVRDWLANGLEKR